MSKNHMHKFSLPVKMNIKTVSEQAEFMVEQSGNMTKTGLVKEKVY
jgi:hypothetical protein